MPSSTFSCINWLEYVRMEIRHKTNIIFCLSIAGMRLTEKNSNCTTKASSCFTGKTAASVRVTRKTLMSSQKSLKPNEFGFVQLNLIQTKATICFVDQTVWAHIVQLAFQHGRKRKNTGKLTGLPTERKRDRVANMGESCAWIEYLLMVWERAFGYDIHV